MSTWLVTGGAGFIGGNFVLDAVASGVRVVNLDALTYAGNPDTLSSLSNEPNHVFVQGDIGHREVVSRLLAEHRPDAIVNFAAESHVDRSIDGPAEFVQTNVVGTLGLLECSRDFWRGLEGAARDAFRLPARTDMPADQLPQWAQEVIRDWKPAPVDWDLIEKNGQEWMATWDRTIRGKG